MKGRIIRSLHIDNQEMIDLNMEDKGIYIMQINSEKGNETHKLIIQ